jgi:peptidoglycan/LPS O-acetylase OafA/YrhL
MTRATSLFLDVLRLGAALVVFAAHTTNYWNPSLMGPMQVWAHDAVIVFFVLSGYVIAHTTKEGSRDARQYTIARLSRLYSVVVPALILTAVCWIVGRGLEPELYATYERAHPWLRFAASSVFMNEVWRLEISPPTNTPFWSLGYEAWYYVFFGLMVFVRSPRMKWLAVIAAALVAGPNVLALLPVWLIGMAAYVYRDVGRVSRPVAIIGCVAAAMGTYCVLRHLPDWPETPGAHPWYFAGAAVSDAIGGLGWGALIWFFNRVFVGAGIGQGTYRSVRWMAGHTFSLYLYHAPLVILATALVPPFMVVSMEWVPIVVVLGIILVLGAVTESQRPRWQRFFGWIWDRLFQRNRATGAA